MRFKVGDLVYRKYSSVAIKYVPRESKFFGLGIILKELWAIDGIIYYSVYEEGELLPEATVKKYLTVRQEGKRE